MPKENKINFWGELDNSKEALKRTASAYTALLKGGEFRMTWYNIERMDKYLEEIQESIRTITNITDEFRPIAAKQAEKEL